MELAHPVEVAELSLEVDASSTHVGAVLHQHTGSVKRPLGFFSVKLNSAQQKYSAFDHKLLACYLGIRHFRPLAPGGQTFLRVNRSQAAHFPAS